MDYLGILSVWIILIAIILSCLINLYVFLVILFLLFDMTIGRRIWVEDIHHERKKKVKLVKKDNKNE